MTSIRSDQVSAPLYTRLFIGTPGTSLGAYTMVMFSLGMGTPFDNLMDTSRDEIGLVMDQN